MLFAFCSCTNALYILNNASIWILVFLILLLLWTFEIILIWCVQCHQLFTTTQIRIIRHFFPEKASHRFVSLWNSSIKKKKKMKRLLSNIVEMLVCRKNVASSLSQLFKLLFFSSFLTIVYTFSERTNKCCKWQTINEVKKKPTFCLHFISTVSFLFCSVLFGSTILSCSAKTVLLQLPSSNDNEIFFFFIVYFTYRWMLKILFLMKIWRYFKKKIVISIGKLKLIWKISDKKCMFLFIKYLDSFSLWFQSCLIDGHQWKPSEKCYQ